MNENSTTWPQRQTPTSESFTWSGPASPISRFETSTDGEKNDRLLKQPEAPLGVVQTQEDGTEYPRGVKMSLIVLALCLAVFLMALEYSTRPRSPICLTDWFIEAIRLSQLLFQRSQTNSTAWQMSAGMEVASFSWLRLIRS